MKDRILIVDSTFDPHSWGARDIRRYSHLTLGLPIEVRRAPQYDLPTDWTHIKKIILTGSKSSCLSEDDWVLKLHQWIRNAMGHQIPMLGICFGHQTIARALGSLKTVRKSPTPEFGWTRVRTTRPNPLFRGLNQEFYSLSSHYEEIVTLPPDLEQIAESDRCVNQAYQHRNAPVFGIQFHPEKTFEDSLETLENLRKKKEDQLYQHAKDGKKWFDPMVGEIIFKNFLAGNP